MYKLVNSGMVCPGRGDETTFNIKEAEKSRGRNEIKRCSGRLFGVLIT